MFIFVFFVCFFNVTPAQYRYGDVPALLVEEDLFRALFQTRTGTLVEPPTFR
jgi:hypothetical protein